ncbi:YjzC family protein [Aquisphaera insulae]|uniref:YjzC family protein n=1 Tax=Aquisphaera insulae TaxID=2712864 RepID=UPI0013EB1E74|nr:YjzC family protein [Aquisphaera insulae]
MSTSTQVRIHTGQPCPASGIYRFDGYLDGTIYPSPLPGEREVALSRPNIAPPIRSANKGCFWLLVRPS